MTTTQNQYKQESNYHAPPPPAKNPIIGSYGLSNTNIRAQPLIDENTFNDSEFLKIKNTISIF